MPWRKAYLDKILEAGFDGVYLDRVDVFGEWSDTDRHVDKDMVRFVALLSAYSKKRKPGFLVVPQNGEELLRFKDYRRVIDGFAKEDLFYGIEGDGEQNSEREIRKSLRFLSKAAGAGLPVFVVEYLEAAQQRARVRGLISARGYLLNFAERALDRPPQLLLAKSSAEDGKAKEKPDGAEREPPSVEDQGTGAKSEPVTEAAKSKAAENSPQSTQPAFVPPLKRQKPTPFSAN